LITKCIEGTVSDRVQFFFVPVKTKFIKTPKLDKEVCNQLNRLRPLTPGFVQHAACMSGFTNGGVVGRGTALQAGRSRVRFPMGPLGFFIDAILPDAAWP
jgi:hypothetical protein